MVYGRNNENSKQQQSLEHQKYQCPARDQIYSSQYRWCLVWLRQSDTILAEVFMFHKASFFIFYTFFQLYMYLFIKSFDFAQKLFLNKTKILVWLNVLLPEQINPILFLAKNSFTWLSQGKIHWKLDPGGGSVTLLNFIFDDPSVKPYEFLTNGILDLHVKVYCLTACDASEKCPPENSGT